MKKTNNERNAGRPPKFSKGGKIIAVKRYIPEKGRVEIMKAVDKVIDQFKDYDFT